MENDFPILGTKLGFPSILLAPHEERAMRNHGGQTLQRLRERGGLTADEMVAILEDRYWSTMDFGTAWKRLIELRAEAIKTR